MREETRRAIAHAAASRVNGPSRASIYSYASGRYSAMSPTYDFETRAHISPSSTGLYHYGTNSHISFSVKGRNFSGYDYSTGHHYSGEVSGSSVTLYDYGESRHFSYSV
jgi:hypothetical protein